MIAALVDCCCEVIEPCSLIEPIVLHDGWTDEGHFYYYVYSRTTYFEVVYYSSLCNVDLASLRFTVNKAVGVTSNTVSIEAYNRILTFQHYVFDYSLYAEAWFYHNPSPDVCSEVVCETYTAKNIKDFYRYSNNGGFYFEYFIYQIKKFVPTTYVLSPKITPVGCEDYI